MGTSIDTVMVVVTLAAGLWWGFARRRRPEPASEALHRGAGAGGCHAGGGGPALAARSLAGPRCRGRGRRRLPALAAGSFAPLAAGHRTRHAGRRAGARWAGAPDGVVPALPAPSGPHSVGSVVFRWTDNQRSETFTADPSDRRQVIAQALVPDRHERRARQFRTSRRRAVCPGRSMGLPAFMFGVLR